MAFWPVFVRVAPPVYVGIADEADPVALPGPEAPGPVCVLVIDRYGVASFLLPEGAAVGEEGIAPTPPPTPELVADDPVVDEPVADEPVADEPVADDPVAEGMEPLEVAGVPPPL